MTQVLVNVNKLHDYDCNSGEKTKTKKPNKLLW